MPCKVQFLLKQRVFLHRIILLKFLCKPLPKLILLLLLWKWGKWVEFEPVGYWFIRRNNPSFARETCTHSSVVYLIPSLPRWILIATLDPLSAIEGFEWHGFKLVGFHPTVLLRGRELSNIKFPVDRFPCICQTCRVKPLFQSNVALADPERDFSGSGFHNPRGGDAFFLTVEGSNARLGRYASSPCRFNSCHCHHILSTPQCSSGTTQSRPFPARAVKIMESARQHTRGRRSRRRGRASAHREQFGFVTPLTVAVAFPTNGRSGSSHGPGLPHFYAR